ncbi:MAG TPA: T9SS type A sorting domain-containing protein, partial [Chitinophagales bacterium]|nr:T9SS type A sorting domain-containing protein [Chitinophagales bacterium]
SMDGDITGNNGDTDFWIVKLDAAGMLMWENCLGGSDYDFAYSVQQTFDAGFIVAGYSHSNDGDISGNHGSTDYCLMKLDVTGNLTWQKSLGGSDYDQAYSIQQTADSNYIVAGLSFSNDGDVSGNHVTPQGTTQDCWIVKLTNDVTGISFIPDNIISVYPNPVQHQLTIDLQNITSPLIQVIDLHGRKIQLPVTFSGEKAMLSTSGLTAGFYMLQIIDHFTGKTVTGSFIKK